MKYLCTKPDGSRLDMIARRPDFLRVAKGSRAAAKGVVLQFLTETASSDDAPLVRVGFTATKKVGGSVQRNRAKRRLRDAAREILGEHGVPGCAYVLIARPETLIRPFDRLKADLRWALARVHEAGTQKNTGAKR
jgi:ribonuclease P protein component